MATLPSSQSDVRGLWLVYLLVTIAAGAFLSSYLFAGDELGIALKMIGAGLLLLSVWRWPGALLLIGLQCYLFLREPRFLFSSDPLGVAAVAGLGLLLVMLLGRVQTLQQLLHIDGARDWLRAMRAALSAEPNPTEQSPQASAVHDMQNQKSGSLWPRALGWLGMACLLCVGLAFVILWLVPLDGSSHRNLRLTPTGLRTIQIAFLLATTGLVVSTFVGELLWRRSSTAQAQIYLLTSLMSWIGRDLRLVAIKKRQLRRRAASAK